LQHKENKKTTKINFSYYFQQKIQKKKITLLFLLLSLSLLPDEVSKGKEKYKNIAQELEYAELNNY